LLILLLLLLILQKLLLQLLLQLQLSNSKLQKKNKLRIAWLFFLVYSEIFDIFLKLFFE
jgi:hypothetical protein